MLDSETKRVYGMGRPERPATGKRETVGKLQVVVGGMFGSEGKGAVSAYLAAGRDTLASVRVAGPNAGHSAYDTEGRKWALQQVPVAGVVNRGPLYIAAGSEIDPDVLQRELELGDAAGLDFSMRLFVDRQATIITQEHMIAEYGGEGLAHGSSGLTQRIGSTGKGVGAARADRIRREAMIAGGHIDVAERLYRHLGDGNDVLVEGTQGYGLGLHAGYYPYCTSSDCRAIDMLAMAGVSPWAPVVDQFEVWVVMRTFPIRVAGNSGPMYNEITWEQVGQEVERTTVTKKPRRIGEWDADLAKAAVEANGGFLAKVAMQFIDYVFPELAGETNSLRLKAEHWHWKREREAEIGARIEILGTGGNTCIDLRGE